MQVSALSEGAGAPMVPLSWEEMQCPTSGEREKRKVANVQGGEPAAA